MKERGKSGKEGRKEGSKDTERKNRCFVQPVFCFHRSSTLRTSSSPRFIDRNLVSKASEIIVRVLHRYTAQVA